MRIAVACDGLCVAPYFVQTTSYAIYSVEHGTFVGSNNMPALDQTIPQLAQLLKQLDIDAFIVGKIDSEMASTLRTSGADLVTDAKDDPLMAAREYISSVFFAGAD